MPREKTIGTRGFNIIYEDGSPSEISVLANADEMLDGIFYCFVKACERPGECGLNSQNFKKNSAVDPVIFPYPAIDYDDAEVKVTSLTLFPFIIKTALITWEVV